MTWNIVCDSSCDLTPAMFDTSRVGFYSVPLKILVGNAEFVDDAALHVPDLLAAMRAEKSASSSSCPSPADFAKAFETADCSVCFCISGALSGTYNSAVMGRNLVLEEHPEKKICVIDTKSTSGAMILLARKALALIEKDDSDPEAIFDQLRQDQAALRTCFTLECFDNLIKNGRMRPLVGTVLKSLGIHVIADATAQGTIHVCGKARGETKTYQGLAELMGKSKDCTGAEVIISHCENLKGAMKLKECILANLPVKSVELVSCRGLTTFYAMEKGMIIVY